jgi:hypothetical protein
MSISGRVRVAFFAGVTIMGLASIGTVVPAYASSAAVSRVVSGPDISCNFSGAEKIYDVTQTHGNEVRHIQLWYSTSSRCVWAEETNGQPSDIVWVWNIITHATSSVTSNGHSAATGEISDDRSQNPGSESHACMTPKYSDGSYGPKTCTPYF